VLFLCLFIICVTRCSHRNDHCLRPNTFSIEQNTGVVAIVEIDGDPTKQIDGDATSSPDGGTTNEEGALNETWAFELHVPPHVPPEELFMLRQRTQKILFDVQISSGPDVLGAVRDGLRMRVHLFVRCMEKHLIQPCGAREGVLEFVISKNGQIRDITTTEANSYTKCLIDSVQNLQFKLELNEEIRVRFPVRIHLGGV
jgi:hypothetical protein